MSVSTSDSSEDRCSKPRICWPSQDFTNRQRSGSFDSFDMASQLNGPEFQHKPLQYDIDDDGHRTLSARKWEDDRMPYAGPPGFTMSGDNLYESYLRRFNYVASSETASQASNNSLDSSENSSLVSGAFKADQEAETMSESNEGLCSRCCVINIESLSQEGGYTHWTLDVLGSSAWSCELCRTLWDYFGCVSEGWSLERYKVTLSLDPSASDTTVLKDNHDSNIFSHPQLWKCVWIRVLDTRPWQPPEDKEYDWRLKRVVERDPLNPEQPIKVSVCDVRMACYTEEIDPAVYAGVPWLRIMEYTGSAGSINVARDWLKQCLAVEGSSTSTDHDTDDQDPEYDPADYGVYDYGLKSLAPFPVERPTRLVEIVTCEDPENPYDHSLKLIETIERDYTYAALSYCWGKIADATWLTTHDTIQQHFQAIDMGSLPATIKDCVQVAVSLDIDHVWVDCLCIIQDSESDWEIESAKMGGIYKGAILTIAASRSSHSSDGCFNRDKSTSSFRDFTLGEYTCVESSLRNGQMSRLYLEKTLRKTRYDNKPGSELFVQELYGSHLSTRAWVYQEQMLSTRTLYFGEWQCYWECEHCRLSQDNLPWQRNTDEQHYPVLNFKKPMRKWEVMKYWYGRAVEAYTQRKLTNPHDRLVAISAVANATFLNRHVRYLACLWEDCLLEGLCWFRSGKGRRSTTFRCPSWSWASQESAVSYGGNNNLLFNERLLQVLPNLPTCNILDSHVIPSDNNPFGNVQSGRITLHTRITSGKVLRDIFGDLRSRFDFQGRSAAYQALVISEQGGHCVWQGVAVLDDDGYKCRQVVVALLGINTWHEGNSESVLLLLEQSSEDEHIYTRVGLGILRTGNLSLESNKKPNFARGWTEKRITII